MSTKNWMKETEKTIYNDLKTYVKEKGKTIHGLIILHGQGDFQCWCDYEEKEELNLYQADDWKEGGDDIYFTDYEFWDLDFGEDADDIEEDFDELEEELSDMGYLLISIIISNVVINLKNDHELKDYFSDHFKIGMSLDETNEKPTFHGDYFGGYKPDSRTLKYIIKYFAATKEDEALILDLIKEQPKGPGLALWKQLYGQYSLAPSEKKLTEWHNKSLKWLKKEKYKKVIKNIEPGIQSMADEDNDGLSLQQAMCCNQVGLAYLGLNNIDKAFSWFKRSYELSDDGFGGINLTRIYIDHHKNFKEGLELATVLKKHMNKIILVGYSFKFWNLFHLLKARLGLQQIEEAKVVAQEFSEFLHKNDDSSGLEKVFVALDIFFQEGIITQETFTDLNAIVTKAYIQ